MSSIHNNNVVEVYPKTGETIVDGHAAGRGEKSFEISDACRTAVEAELHKHFRPEFLNRLDEIIMFRPLSKENISAIIDLLVADINRRLADRQLTVKLTDAAKKQVADDAYDPSYGARPLKRYIQKYVETMVARLILEDKVHEGSTIVIDSRGGQLEAAVEG